MARKASNAAKVVPISSSGSKAKLTSTIGELFGLEGKARGVAVNYDDFEHPYIPAIDTHYSFKENDVRTAMVWAGGEAGIGLLLDGPTGCGKSSLVEQFCNRLNKPLYRLACHARMEFSELVGRTVIKSDGSTAFVDGPLLQAMQTGSTFLLDEINFLPPGMVGALNTVLDRAPLFVPEKDEMIFPHASFRIAATGNGVASDNKSQAYRGTNRMNLALLQRFIGIKCDFLPPIDEVQLLHKVAPEIPGQLLSKMVEIANEIRKSFADDDVTTTMGTRTLKRWAVILNRRAANLDKDPHPEMLFTLQMALTNLADHASAFAIEELLQRHVKGITL